MSAKIAILKPDHLGDMVLSIPAVRSIKEQLGEVDLFLSPAGHVVQQHFLSDVNSEIVNFPHLTKGSGGDLSISEITQKLNQYEMVFFLRQDPVMDAIANSLDSFVVQTASNEIKHETVIQQEAVCSVLSDYERSFFFPRKEPSWPSVIETVGLCISAGFRANKWSITNWRSLAEAFLKAGKQLFLVGGPQEEDELAILARWLDLGDDRVIIGTSDLSLFMNRIAQCDVVIGTDSGSLHLCSCVIPVLGIFSSSPWRRYSPFGSENRVITADLSCSPCCQYSSDIVNGCVTMECSFSISPSDVFDALFKNIHEEEETKLGQNYLYKGVSHLGGRSD